MIRLLQIALASSLLASPAWTAEPGVAAMPAVRKVAVVVGANGAPEGRQPLRYSYLDARSVVSVLEEVGGFAPSDVILLEDPEPAAILRALDTQLAALNGAPESLLLFYYSGHADNGTLFPSGKPLHFSELRKRLESPAATVRVGIIDACSGGGWTGAKGVRTDVPFVVEVPLQLSSEGSVLISSSSGLEEAHESERLDGSFFTHHFVAALRGAADVQGDGVITLNDAFNYAKERTVRDSAAASEPQHPSYSMNLRGRAVLPLTRLASAPTLLEVRARRDSLQLIQLSTGLIILEVPPGKPLKLSVPPGRYLVKRQSREGTWSREIAVAPGKPTQVDEADLALSVETLPVKGLAGPAKSLIDLNPVTLIDSGDLSLEFETAISQSWTAFASIGFYVPFTHTDSGGEQVWELGASLSANWYPGGEALHGWWLGPLVGADWGRDSYAGESRAHGHILAGADAGYTFFPWPHWTVSLGLGVGASYVRGWSVSNGALVESAGPQVVPAGRGAVGYAW